MAHGNPYQSCLTPYEKEIFALLQTKGKKKSDVTYEQIANLIFEKYQLKITPSAIFKFVRVRKNLVKIGKPTDVTSLRKFRRKPVEYNGTLTRLNDEEIIRVKRQFKKEKEIADFTIEDVASKIILLEDELARLEKVDKENSVIKQECLGLQNDIAQLKIKLENALTSSQNLVRQHEMEKNLIAVHQNSEREGNRNLVKKHETTIERLNDEISQLNSLHKKESEQFAEQLDRETTRYLELEKELADLREKLAAELAAKEQRLSSKIKKLISG